MADTKRTYAEIAALLADNTSRLISPQDLRDAIRSLQPGLGVLYVTSPAATVITDSVSFFPINGTWTLVTDPPAQQWDESGGNGKLTYIGESTRVVKVTAELAYTAASANQDLEFTILKNAAEVPHSTIEDKKLVAADKVMVSLFALVEVVNADEIEVAVKNTTGANNITASKAMLAAVDAISQST